MSEPQALVADRYRLLNHVGSGGMGVVWEAWDERLERRVAVKQLRRQSGASTVEAELANKRAMREARLTARLQHPHAVSVFDVVEQDGQLWLIMQFVPSITLAAVLHDGGPLQPNEAAQVGALVASALTAAHAVGIVHRDVKPGNILIAEDGTALISDFGIAHALGDATLTTSGMIHGTPAYLAPEVARGNEANFAADVFSLGATLYSAMEGTPPFGTDENSIALLHRVASGQFPPPQRSGALTPIILEMLSADPGARPSMRGVADNLARLAAGSSSARDQAAALSASEEGPTAGEIDQVPTHDLSSPKTGQTTASGHDSPAALAPEGLNQRSTQPRRNRVVAAAVAVIALIGVGILIAAMLPDDRKASRSSDRSRSVDLRRAREHQTLHSAAVRHSERSSSARIFHSAARSTADGYPTNQSAYALPCAIANDRTNGPGYADGGTA